MSTAAHGKDTAPRGFGATFDEAWHNMNRASADRMQRDDLAWRGWYPTLFQHQHHLQHELRLVSLSRSAVRHPLAPRPIEPDRYVA